MSQQPPVYKYPSMTSIHSMVSLGYLPPGHGYIPKKQKPEKPYGPSFVSIMNRTWRGPGRKYINYAVVVLSADLVFYTAAALYFGHRNVSRMIVLNTEGLGAILLIIAILLTCLFFWLIHRAREESNKWRSHVRFRAEGLFTAAAYNHAYVPEDEMKLLTGTYGPRAVKEIPKPKGMRTGRSRATSKLSLTGAQIGPGRRGRVPMSAVMEGEEGLEEEADELPVKVPLEDLEPELPTVMLPPPHPQAQQGGPLPAIHLMSPPPPPGSELSGSQERLDGPPPMSSFDTSHRSIRSPHRFDPTQMKSPPRMDPTQPYSPQRYDPMELRSPPRIDPTQPQTPQRYDPMELRSPPRMDPTQPKTPQRLDPTELRSPLRMDPTQPRTPQRYDPAAPQSMAAAQAAVHRPSPQRFDPALMRAGRSTKEHTMKLEGATPTESDL